MRLLLVLVLFGWSNLAFSVDQELLRGQWGGAGISMWATPSGADIDLHCSWGRISQPIYFDEDSGEFSVEGFVDYYSGQPPIKKIAVTYVGVISDESMKLTVNFPDREPWEFTLSEGELGKAGQCR